nr:hypothetical protein [Tanacetum cinerariifolium]
VFGGCWEVVGNVLESRGNGTDGLEKREKVLSLGLTGD